LLGATILEVKVEVLFPPRPPRARTEGSMREELFGIFHAKALGTQRKWRVYEIVDKNRLTSQY